MVLSNYSNLGIEIHCFCVLSLTLEPLHLIKKKLVGDFSRERVAIKCPVSLSHAENRTTMAPTLILPLL